MSRPRVVLTWRGVALLSSATLAVIASALTWRPEVVSYALMAYLAIVIDLVIVLVCGSRLTCTLERRELPRRIIAGSTGVMRASLRLSGPWSYVEVLDALPEGLEACLESRMWRGRVRGVREVHLEYEVRALARGTYEVQPPRVVALSVFDTVRVLVPVEGVKVRVDVVPYFYTLPVAMRACRMILPGAAGSHILSLEGAGVEFKRLRAYMPGDDYRRISWKHTAKNPEGTPIVKATHVERQLNLMVVVDASEATLLEGRGRRLIDDLVEAAGALLIAAHKLGDRTSLLTLGERGVFFPPSRREGDLLACLRELETLWPTLRPVDVWRVVRVAGRMLRKGTVIVILSSWEFPGVKPRRLVEALRVLGHVVLSLIPHTPSYAPPPPGSPGLRRVYEELLEREEARLRVLLRELSACGVAYRLFTPGSSVREALALYYSARVRMP